MRCDDFYEKWRRCGNFCEKHPSTASQIGKYLDQIEEMEQVLSEASKEDFRKDIIEPEATTPEYEPDTATRTPIENSAISHFSEWSIRPLIAEKDDEIRHEAIRRSGILVEAKERKFGKKKARVSTKEMETIIGDIKRENQLDVITEKKRGMSYDEERLLAYLSCEIDDFDTTTIYVPDKPVDFKPQLYNIWNFAKITNETRHPGNIPHEIIENMLYYYTEPFDVVFDPFGGGGVTIDVCKAWNRRYFVSDIMPTEIAKEKGMRTHDITTGLPDGLPKPNMVFLDPPYWNQVQGKYTDNTSDLSNMTLEEFYKSFDAAFEILYKKMVDGGVLAFIIGNTQWTTEDKHVEPHSHIMWNIAEAAGFKFEHIIHVPYSTQQYNGNMVNYAKEHKIILQLNRELIIMRKPIRGWNEEYKETDNKDLYKNVPPKAL